MNYRKKSLIFSILLISIIQIFLLINNRQKTSLRYFIWIIQDVSIGRLICVSFISGFLISSILNNTLHNDIRTFSVNEEDKTTAEDDYFINREDKDESNEIPPERDLRDPQPTISVNYRVIKDNGENELKDRNQSKGATQYQDDWSTNDSEW